MLSCGGRIWQQAQAGETVLVVTVFGAPAPNAPLSPFAQQLHARWEYSANMPLKRQEEDLAALSLLEAQAVHWPYPDCIYRRTPDGRFLYASEESLWGKVHPAEAGLIAELAAQIAGLPLRQGSALYVPLGVGQHVDHQIVRRAAEDAGRALIYYEDFPYARDTQALQGALGSEQWQAEIIVLSEEALIAKIAAVARYRSQLSTFWTDEAEMAASIRTFAERTGGGQPAERYWRHEVKW